MMPVAFRPWSPARIAARDRRATAVHEAGHIVIARFLGARGWAAIWPLAVADPITDRTWAGRASFYRPRTMSRWHRIQIGTAGVIAEAIHRSPDDRDEWADAYLPTVMSPTDLTLAGLDAGAFPDAYAERAMQRVAWLLDPARPGSLWPGVLAEARAMMRDARAP